MSVPLITVVPGPWSVRMRVVAPSERLTVPEKVSVPEERSFSRMRLLLKLVREPVNSKPLVPVITALSPSRVTGLGNLELPVIA